jgi:hypothetical protein
VDDKTIVHAGMKPAWAIVSRSQQLSKMFSEPIINYKEAQHPGFFKVGYLFNS